MLENGTYENLYDTTLRSFYVDTVDTNFICITLSSLAYILGPLDESTETKKQRRKLR